MATTKKNTGALSSTLSNAQTLSNLESSQPGAYKQSSNVKGALNNLNTLKKPDSYKPSSDVTTAKNNLNNLVKPNAYTSSYSDQISGMLDNILNRDKFTYNMDGDALYQQYKDQYTQAGKTAMQDTMGEAAILSGGYGNSYASTAGNQAYQSYLSQLNDKIPELYDRAYSRYQDEGNNMYNQLSALQTQDNTDYGRYRDTVGDYKDDRTYYSNEYNNAYNRDYGQYRDKVSDYYSDYGNRYDMWQALQNQDYNQYRDSVGDYKDNRSYYYGKTQDDQTQSNWQTQFNYGKSQDALTQKNWQTTFDYNKSQDAQDQSNWQKQFDRSNMESDRDYALSNAKLASSVATNSSSVNDDEPFDMIEGRKTLTEYMNNSSNDEETVLAMLQTYGGQDGFYEWLETMTGPNGEKGYYYDILRRLKGEDTSPNSNYDFFNQKVLKGAVSENVGGNGSLTPEEIAENKKRTGTYLYQEKYEPELFNFLTNQNKYPKQMKDEDRGKNKKSYFSK